MTWNLKYVYGVVVCLTWLGQTTAQITFSKRFTGVYSGYGSWIRPASDGYRLIGLTRDTLNGYAHKDLLFIKLDDYGEKLEIKHFGEESLQLHPYSRMTADYIDGGFIVGCGTTLGDSDQMALVWMNAEGDTLRTKKYSSPYSTSEDESIRRSYGMRHLLSDSIGNIYVSANFYLSQTEGRISAIIKYNPEGEMLWITPVVETISSQSAIMQMYLTDSMLFTAGAIINAGSAGQSLDPNNRYFERYAALTLEGELLWMNEERPEFNCQSFRDILATPEGLIILSNYFPDHTVLTDPVLHKVGWNNELVWAHPYPPENEISGFRRIAKTCDGQYIIAGQFRTGDGMGGWDTYATLTKTDTWGNIVWTRKYTYVDSYQNEHEMLDLKPTPDGGFVMVGDAVDEWLNNPDLELPIQQLWIVKTDACGCLIPGCDPDCVHAPCPTDAPEQPLPVPLPGEVFLVGPNPFSNQLFVHLTGQGLNSDAAHTMEIRDIRGALVGHYALGETEATYIIRTEAWAEGLYVIALFEDGRKVATKKVVKGS